jgi:hypothetical protein
MVVPSSSGSGSPTRYRCWTLSTARILLLRHN